MGRKKKSMNSIFRLPTGDLADCILLVKTCSPILHIFGSASIRIAVGSVIIHGHDLNDDKWHHVCSSGVNLVTVELSSKHPIKSTNKIVSGIGDRQTRAKVKTELKRANDVGCVIFFKANWLTSKLQCEDLFDLNSCLDSDELASGDDEFRKATSDLGFTVFYELPKSCSSLNVYPRWNTVCDLVSSFNCNKADAETSVILICGGKNVGKSTFAKYLMNTILNREEALYFLETDVGQTEFTPSGILSLVKVNKPIFGPPFTHLTKPERAVFFGDTTPKDFPSSYVRLISSLYKYYNDFCRGAPLVVNTCGWVKGMGVRVLLDIVRIVRPTDVIQINSPSQPMKNLPVLTVDFLSQQESWTCESHDSVSVFCPPRIFEMEAFENHPEIGKCSGLQSTDLRMLSLLTYFGSHQSVASALSVREYIQDYATIYSVPFHVLKIHHVCDDVCSDNSLYSIIGSVVGLVKSSKICELDEMNYDDSVRYGEYIGLGIVRNVDVSKDRLFIITPEPLESLNEVDVLLKGRLEILDCLFKAERSRSICIFHAVDKAHLKWNCFEDATTLFLGYGTNTQCQPILFPAFVEYLTKWINSTFLEINE